MDKKFCIFDMDGTLVDSMGYWRDLGRAYLRAKGVEGERAEAVLAQIKPLTMLQAAQLFADSFGFQQPAQAMVDEMNAMMEVHYLTDVPLKPGMREYLERCKAAGCRMCVATATAEPLARACLERLGIHAYFEFVLSCETMGISKQSRHIYLEAARRFGSRPEETAVFEDAPYAARTAKQAGFYTVAVREDVRTEDWKALVALADETVEHWSLAVV